MIDLNNTWCEATEENYNALMKYGIKDNYYSCFNDRIKSYNFSNIFIMVYDNEIDLLKDGNEDKNFKQIHLVNGEFQFVETKPKNNFKEYGFEADFEGEILKQIDDMYIGYYLNKKDCPISCTWWSDGLCSVGTDLEDYILKPIKKEWYEAESNFEAYKGKLIINKYGNIRRIQSIDKSKVSTAEQNMYHDILKVDKWRPLTKEEVLDLLVKE